MGTQDNSLPLQREPTATRPLAITKSTYGGRDEDAASTDGTSCKISRSPVASRGIPREFLKWLCGDSALSSCILHCESDVSLSQRVSDESRIPLSFSLHHNQAPHLRWERRPMESHSTPHGGVPSDPATSHPVGIPIDPYRSPPLSHVIPWDLTGLATG